MVNLGKRIPTSKDPLEAALRELLKNLIKQSPRGSRGRGHRQRIADEMTQRVGRSVSKRMIDDWTSPKMRARFPAAYIEAFCEAISDDTLQRHVIGQRLRELLGIGESVTDAAGSLKRAHEAVSRVIEQARQEKEKDRRPWKA